jgi:pimeloyl-ACP methyl ester carboxylesterase
MAELETVSYPGARRPDRARSVDAHGIRIAVWEWGPPTAPPLLLAHGGFDFAGTFDGFAPLLAGGGWRVVSWDQRGHGDSEHAELYTWSADTRDAMLVLDSTSPSPLPLVGHSKGGGLMNDLALLAPERVTRLVNIDGLPSPRTHPDVAEHERTQMRHDEITGWLDHRRRAAGLERKPGTLDELARRRARMNPRLPLEWLRYLVTVGARHDPDGWRWKIDPSMRFGGFGPWRPEWGLYSLPNIRVPFLGMLGLIEEEMGWGTEPDAVRPYLPPGATLEAFPDTGHFIHIERPRQVADRVLEFLA